MEELRLNDIAEDLLILNKITINRLFQLENCADCIALYVFYYKTAKWQKTNMVKVNDHYIKKSLKWGLDKIRRTKNTLKEHGLIDMVQRRNKEGKIEGWYVKISYLITEKKLEDTKVIIETNHTTQNPQVVEPTSGEEEINALKEKIKYLKKKILILEGNDNSNTSIIKDVLEYMNNCGIWENFKTKKSFSFNPKANSNIKIITARINEGNTLDDFKDVIYHTYDKFVENEFKGLNGKSSIQYYRPSTLFSSENMEKYKNEYKNL